MVNVKTSFVNRLGDRNMVELDVRAVMIEMTPIQASHEIFPRVRILPVRNPRMAATTTKAAVQVPCRDNALKAVDIPENPAAATQIHPARCQHLF